MKNFFEKLRVEDWVVVWVSIPLLLLAALIPRRPAERARDPRGRSGVV